MAQTMKLRVLVVTCLALVAICGLENAVAAEAGEGFEEDDEVIVCLDDAEELPLVDDRVRELKRCVAMEDDRIDAVSRLANALAEQGELEQAEVMFQGVYETSVEDYVDADAYHQDIIRIALSDYIIMLRNWPARGPRVAAEVFWNAKQLLPYIVWEDTTQLPPVFNLGFENKPWWNPEEFGFNDRIRSRFPAILQELKDFIRDNEDMTLESDHALVNRGEWVEYLLWENGKFNVTSCSKHYTACEAVANEPSITGWERGVTEYNEDTALPGQVTFMRVTPGTHLRAHVGPENHRLTAQLAMIVPPGLVFRVSQLTIFINNSPLQLTQPSCNNDNAPATTFFFCVCVTSVVELQH
eukprot:m.30728 g.30728  ORF g.30728 m.30728 type:complete len:355 (+) comp9325_c0_seq1:170-1234(+)